jgi:hypothetical protein
MHTPPGWEPGGRGVVAGGAGVKDCSINSFIFLTAAFKAS